MSAASINTEASRLLAHPQIAPRVAQHQREATKAVQLTAVRAIERLRQIIDADPRKLFWPDGTQKLVHELDDDTAAAVASVEIAPDGSQRIKFWDKNSALNMASKYLGLFRKENMQQQPNLKLEVLIVGGPDSEMSDQDGQVSLLSNGQELSGSRPGG